MAISSWNAGIIRPVAVAPAGPYQDGTASGIWTLEEAAFWNKQGLWPDANNINPDRYIENLFSTYLYTGNGTSQTITNGIDLSTKGGLVWIRDRDSGAKGHGLFDTARGVNLKLQTQSTNGQFSNANQLTAFNTTGFALGTTTDQNGSGTAYTSWTFRKQPKFFDVVTYTGNGTTQNIPHSLGATPGCIIVKNVSSSNGWQTWHRGLTSGYRILLNSDAVETNVAIAAVFGNNSAYVAPTSTQFTVGNEGAVNQSGETMVAYIFAHNAGGFGLSGSDNVISCGSFTSDAGGNATVNLGYEPQWLLYKTSGSNPSDWRILDNMRNWSRSGALALAANLADVETSFGSETFFPTQNGFTFANANLASSSPYIYIAIRRGPMKVPTSGTSVFTPNTRTGNGAVTTLTGLGFTPDFLINTNQTRAVSSYAPVQSRLQGAGRHMYTSLTNAEATDTNGITGWDAMDGIKFGNDSTSGAWNWSSQPYINWFFKRAPGFFDVVCYTGTGSGTQTISHNLGVTPELTINKSRSGSRGWTVYYNNTTFLRLNQTTAGAAETLLSPTATTFNADLGAGFGMNAAETYVTYLFATCAGVSKVGSYTGTATTKQVDCGFTAGARFVLIKRTDSTGDWYVWDTARGIISGNDPYLLVNSTAAEVTNTDYIDPYSAGFELSSTAPAAINANGGTYIFLAIA